MKGRIYLWAVFFAVLSASISGCVTTKLVPVYTMPDAPANLVAPLPDLQTIKKTATSGTKNE